MKPVADVLVFHTRLWSDGAPLERADALALAGPVVLAVGREVDLREWVGPRTRCIDAGGGTVTPGLVDSHLHLIAWARSLRELRLNGLGSRAAVVEAVAEFQRRHPGEHAVVGRGWVSDGWSEPPDRTALDRVSDNRPVLLHSQDFHALWVNTEALRRAGLDRSTPDPPGGRLERDASGELTGVVREHATRLLTGLLPAPDPEHDRQLVEEAVRRLHAEGVTAVHDFEGAAEQRLLRAVADGSGPRVRVLAHLAHAGLEAALELGLESGLGDDWFRLGAVKLFADGTLGSRTAALLEPYDGTTEHGLDLIPPPELEALVARATAAGLSVAIHAIGDRAVRSALDALEASAEAVRRLPIPPRIEHVQLVHPDDLGRFARLGVGASMQPVHCTSDMELARRHWRTRLSRSYAWRSLLRAGALLAFGSDAPVEEPRPAAGLHAAVTRQRIDGEPASGFVPAERLSLDEALRAYTEVPARLSGAWPRLGRLAPGGPADLVLWSEDLHRMPAARLHEARPVMTWIDGEAVYERSGPALAGSSGRGSRIAAGCG